MKAGIFGVGAALPDHIVTNAQFEQRLDTSDEWIVRRTGIRERRWLNGRVSLTDLALEACSQALDDAGRAPEDVDQLLVSTLTPDRLMPGLAPELAHRLGLTEAGACDLNAACAGFVYALDHAAALVESGRARSVLVCGAEALSRILDQSDRGTAILFGDAAAAVLVSGGDLDVGCSAFVVRADGEHGDLLFAERDERLVRMAGQKVFRHAVPRMVQALEEALERAHLRANDLDLLVAHQANARIIEAVANELHLDPDKVFLNIDRFANTSSASIPLALWEADRQGRLAPGALVGLVAFGAGFVWGAGIVSWKERVNVFV